MRTTTYTMTDTEAVAAVVWHAVWGDGNAPTTPLARVIAADRAARALAEAGLLAPAPQVREASARRAKFVG